MAATERTPLSGVSAEKIQVCVDEVWKPAPLVPSTLCHGCFLVSSPKVPWRSRRIILGVALLVATNAMGLFAPIYTQEPYLGDCAAFPGALPQTGRTSVAYAFELCGAEGQLQVAVLNQLTMAGAFIGVLVGGSLADLIGRYKTCAIISCLNVLAIAGSAIAPSYSVYAACRFLIGAGCIGAAVPSFAIATEWIPRGWKIPIGVALVNGSSYVFGEILDVVLALFFENWRHFTVAVLVVVSVFTFLGLILIEESPQWLATKPGREKEAFALLGLDIDTVDTLATDVQEGGETNDVVPEVPDAELVYLRLVTWAMAFCWFTASMTYFGISLAISGLKGNTYVSATLSGLSEVPATMLAVYLLQEPAIGRSSGNAMLFKGAAVACFFMYFVVDSAIGCILCMMVGKACVTACFSGLYGYTAELYVAARRGSGMALCSAMGRVGAFLAPLLTAFLPTALMYMVIGSLAAIAAYVCQNVLPETGCVRTKPKT